MEKLSKNRFEDFFNDTNYLSLKNYLYNYKLRKRMVEKEFKNIWPIYKEIILEVGSGISPMVTSHDNVVYADISFSAIHALKEVHKKGFYVVADCTCLPFRSESVSHVVCSEVIEHIANDKNLVMEVERVLKPAGSFVITFPHRRIYFSFDDYFVGHYRRYEIDNMTNLLTNAGLTPLFTKKVLGFLDKFTMASLCLFIRLFKIQSKDKTVLAGSQNILSFLYPFFKWLNLLYAFPAWIDATLTPLRFSTVLLIKAIKDK
jgi:ubiquinone/menaquinone biosynthesis C-methylase UbiE